MPDPRGEVGQWKALPDYLPALLNSIERERNLYEVGQHKKTSDVSSPLEDVESFGDRFGVKSNAKFPGVSGLLRSTRRSPVNGVFPQRENDVQREWSGGTSGLSGTAAGWKRSSLNDVTIGAAISEVEKQIARRRLLEKWLKKV